MIVGIPNRDPMWGSAQTTVRMPVVDVLQELGYTAIEAADGNRIFAITSLGRTGVPAHLGFERFAIRVLRLSRIDEGEFARLNVD